MFLKVAQTQVRLYKELINEYIIKGNSIIEFCQTPLFDDDIKISDFEQKQLKTLIKQVDKIVSRLSELKDEIN